MELIDCSPSNVHLRAPKLSQSPQTQMSNWPTSQQTKHVYSLLQKTKTILVFIDHWKQADVAASCLLGSTSGN